MKDLYHNIKSVRAISPQTISDNTAMVSQIVDKQGFNALEFVIATGTLADANATFTALVEESDASDFATSNAVADGELLGTEAAASFTFADDDAVKTIGYIGNKRYVRLTITPANNTGSASIGAVAVLGQAADNPAA